VVELIADVQHVVVLGSFLGGLGVVRWAPTLATAAAFALLRAGVAHTEGRGDAAALDNEVWLKMQPPTAGEASPCGTVQICRLVGATLVSPFLELLPSEFTDLISRQRA
jgi:hypothetical protein